VKTVSKKIMYPSPPSVLRIVSSGALPIAAFALVRGLPRQSVDDGAWARSSVGYRWLHSQRFFADCILTKTLPPRVAADRFAPTADILGKKPKVCDGLGLSDTCPCTTTAPSTARP
jgi:hypothetical protein